MKKRSISLALAVIFATSSTSPAYAYLDPGTGSLILQGIIGAVAGGLYFFRSYWMKAVALITGGKPSSSKHASTEKVENADREK
ncbi:hypothetical protein [Amphiplicatus metriothermophilus]|nr:hypothetical protein [Amphiplicatus metriothermophilus]MBB5519490.1 hypothetical protein [Amphiplicatus metriothermophilus]